MYETDRFRIQIQRRYAIVTFVSDAELYQRCRTDFQFFISTVQIECARLDVLKKTVIMIILTRLRTNTAAHLVEESSVIYVSCIYLCDSYMSYITIFGSSNMHLAL